MSKLEIQNIKKDYNKGEIVHVLKGVSLSFNDNEFVSILGASGCGKTTLLNIIGGLDHYDDGDILVDAVSTKNYNDADWDSYRNQKIGFVFQNYSLIPHLSVLQNVELALSFAGINAKEKRQRAKDILIELGLEKVINKKPNQLSGGQAQRVSIARALVNNPDIILADEPTGALDSDTGIHVMELLKKISETKLVIMVTHNIELAHEYSTRIIELSDGIVVKKSETITEENNIVSQKSKQKKTSISPLTALSLSFRNLLTKKSRTFFTSLAGGIGIIGVALILALSGGLSNYMGSMQSDSLSDYPITISTADENIYTDMKPYYIRYPDSNVLYRDDESEYTVPHKNVLTNEYLDYVSALETSMPDSINSITYAYNIRLNLINLVPQKQVTDNQFITTGVEEEVGVMSMGGTYMQIMPQNTDFILSQYDLIGTNARLPVSENEAVLVVDEYNQMDVDFFNKLGIHNGINEYMLTDFIGKSIAKVLSNDVFYTEKDGVYSMSAVDDYDRLLESPDGLYLTVVGVLRPKSSAAGNYFKEGVVCTGALMEWGLDNAVNSKINTAQAAADYDILTGLPFEDESQKTKQLQQLGVITMPKSISIYPVDFAANDEIMLYLDAWNYGKSNTEQIVYTNNATTLTSVTGSLISTVYYALVAFACISLIVSGLMIAIITYVSVIERTKEIGILRSIGAGKQDIAHIFEAETLIIGFISGVIGITISGLLTIPINAAIKETAGVQNIAGLNPVQIILLLLGSMLLTLIAGYIPTSMAARKDPVTALRTE